ncbi:MAG: hypothetical protein WBD05_08025 [Phycisphaerae bacterium]
MTQKQVPGPIPPHGGVLVGGLLGGEEASAATARRARRQMHPQSA